MPLPVVNRGRLIQTLRDLVTINSPAKQEAEAAAYVRRALDAIGVASTTDDLHNIYARLPGTGVAPLLLNAHMDTVQPTPDIALRFEHDVLRTDGTTILGADDKAGVAAIIETLRLLQESGRAHAPLDVLFTVQEEIGLRGAKGVDYARLAAREGLCLDSSGPAHQLVVAAPGQNGFDATFIGKSAHAGLAPEAGRSAILAAAQAIAAMPLGRLDPETTANVGVIQGGQASNIVPDRCSLVAEARSRDAAKLARQTEAMASAMRAAADRVGCQLNLTIRESYAAFAHDAATPIVRRCQAAIRSLGKEPQLGATGGGSDANVFNAHGIATILLGVGYEEIHTPNEHIAISSVADLVETVLAIVTSSLS